MTKKLLIAFFMITVGVIFGAIIGFFFAFFHDLPEIRALNSFQPSSVTRIYSADNVLLAELYVEKRDPVDIKDIPETLVKALVATEDRNFYNHGGIYIKGILRAIIKDILAGSFVEGASTITQQLSKTLFLSPKKTITRKIQEAFLSFQLEKRYTKQEIIELYLNQVYFGSGAYGVKSAAQKYFGKNVQDLELTECALLVALLKAPSRYSPRVNMELAVQRRNVVLKQMVKENIIDQATYDISIKKSINLTDHPQGNQKAPYFTDYVKELTSEIIEPKELYRGGFNIYTTLSYEFQQYSENAVKSGLSELQKRMDSNNLSEQDPQAALISIDVSSGGILAMVGGRDYSESIYNRSVKAMRQPGSAFKPFVYALAIEKGFRQSDTLLDSPIAFKNGRDNATWMPQNFSKDYKGEMTLRMALALSKNIPAVRLIETLTPESVINFAHEIGINSPLKANLSLCLGTSETNLLELTSAYAVFPNQGQYVKPVAILRIENQQGRTIWKNKTLKKIVIPREDAAIVTDMLEAVVNEGTGRKAKTIKHPIGGKTGTTDECKDALFVGFSPSIATGVWVGQDKHVTLGKWETGAKAALPIWIKYMQNALAKVPYGYFDIPDGVIEININPVTGKKEGKPGSVPALFRKNNTPK